MGVYVWVTSLALLAFSNAVVRNQTDWQQRNYNTIKAIYNMTIYPDNQVFLAGGAKAIPNGLFSPNASGRITPIGNFSGFENSVEYFFGLTPPVQSPLYGTWTKADIVSFTSGCPEVASSVVYGSTTGVVPNATTFGKEIAKIKQVAFWRFDETGAVQYYDAWLPSLQSYTNLLYGRTTVNETVDAQVIKQLCSNTQAICKGPNQQYSSLDDCQTQLKSKPYGDWDASWGDNVICRTLHIILAKTRPDVRLIKPNLPMDRWLIKDTGTLPSCWSHRRREVCGCRLQ